jgi:hypothetical protein
MIEQSSPPGMHRYGDLYLNVLDDEVHHLGVTPGNSMLSYCTFEQGYFDDLSLYRDVKIEEPVDYNDDPFEYERGVEVVIDISELMDGLFDQLKDSASITLEFFDNNDQRLSSVRFKTDSIKPQDISSEGFNMLEDVPFWMERRFNEKNQFTNIDGQVAPTRIEAETADIESIVGVIDSKRSKEYYPIIVSDGELQLINDESTVEVTGPDIENHQVESFGSVIDVLPAGSLELHTAPGGNPLAVIQERSDAVIRHIVSNVEV